MKSAGFTLIELLTVTAIIGILAGLAIPQFSKYKSKGFDARSLSDLRSAAVAEEAYYTEYSHYVPCTTVENCKVIFPALKSSAGVLLSVTVTSAATGTSDTFAASTYHPDGTRSSTTTAYVWDSANGGLQ